MTSAVHDGAGPARVPRGPASVARYRLAALVYGLGWGAYVPIGGQLYLAEVFALGGLLFFDLGRLVRRHPALRAMLLGYGVFLAAQIVSDMVNGSAPNDYLRGWAGIGFGMINLVFLVALFERTPKALIWYLLGFALARLAAQDLGVEATGIASNVFKERVVPFLSPLALALSFWVARRSSRSAAVFILCVGFFFFLMEARSEGLVFLAGGSLLFLVADERRLSVAKLAVLVVPALCLGYLGYRFYVAHTLADSEMTNSAWQLRLAENPYNPFELLYYGRSAVFVAIEAIGQRPFLGYGSWAPDPTGYFSVLWSRIKGYPFVIHSPYIRAHSVLATAWLWAGIIGFIGAAIVFVTAISRFRSILTLRHPLRPAIVVLMMDFVWNALFSPIGHLRLSFPPVLAIVVVVLGTLRARRRQRASPAAPDAAVLSKPLADRPGS